MMNPQSKVTNFLLYLYTMEFGVPPLYSVMNKAMREKDESYIDTLGPFMYVLSLMTAYGNYFKSNSNKIISGKTIGGYESNMAWSLILFRGA